MQRPRLSRASAAADVSLRVLIADDQALVRTGFRKILECESDIEVVGEAEDGAQAIERCGLLRPDVVLMDIRMPRVDGLQATRDLAGSTRVIILTTFDVNEYVYEALRCGASGFLLKDTQADQLLTAIRVVAQGDALLSPSITRRLIEQFARRPLPSSRPDALAHLTERELEVLQLVARGLSNAEIARELIVGDATVKTHVSRVLNKLGLRDRVQAVVIAYESGLVQPGAG